MPAPDWFKDDIDTAWQEFLDAQNQLSQCERISSNIDFQRNWALKFLHNLGYRGCIPHPEHPEIDCEPEQEKFTKWINGLQNLVQHNIILRFHNGNSIYEIDFKNQTVKKISEGLI